MSCRRLARQDLSAMLSHLDWLAGDMKQAASELRIELAWGDPRFGPNRGRTFRLFEIGKAASFADWNNRQGRNVYVGATLKSADAPEKGRTSADMSVLATCLPIDIDTQFVTSADNLAKIANPQLWMLTGLVPETRGQLFVRIKPTADLASWEDLHRRIVRQCGGDENALGRNRLMRLAGTISFPSPQKQKRGYLIESTKLFSGSGPEYTTQGLLAALPSNRSAPPAPPRVSPRGTRRARPALSFVESALHQLPDKYAISRDLWLRVGFALFDFDPGPTGLSLWQRFSEKCSEKAERTDFEKIWASFSRPYTGPRITIGWLLSEARCSSIQGRQR